MCYDKIKLIVDMFDALQIEQKEYASVMFSAIEEKAKRDRRTNDKYTKNQTKKQKKS